MANDQFIDYYELLQISPSSELETVQRVYRALAVRYDPSNPRTGDSNRYEKLAQAYRVLSDSKARRAYDAEYMTRSLQPMAVFETREFSTGIDSEANRRMALLCLLYHRRRSNPEAPGLSVLQFERLMSCPREHLLFGLWYLKDADLVRQDEASDFVITFQGVDHVEKNLSSYQSLYELLKSAEVGAVERSSSSGEGIAPPDRQS